MTESSTSSLAEAYTDWADGVFFSLADYAANQYGHHVHLHSFASEYLRGDAVRGLDRNNIVHVCLDLLRAVDWTDDWDPSIGFKAKQIDILRDRRAKWQAFADIELNDRQRYLLDVVVRESIAIDEHSVGTEYVGLETILENPDLALAFPDLDRDLAEEELDELVARQMCELHKTLGLTEYRARYGGAAWLSKAQVVSDREIDQLRTEGEHDHLDYKRIYRIGSPSEKAEFTKDILSFANVGGTVSRMLVGVEDDGAFAIPDDPVEHSRLLSKLVDTTLQAIVSERTVIAPSILVQHGEHRDGPFALITVTSKVADIPYRFFTSPSQAKQRGASQSGEVWVRHGTSKRLASADEILALEERARMYRGLFP